MYSTSAQSEWLGEIQHHSYPSQEKKKLSRRDQSKYKACNPRVTPKLQTGSFLLANIYVLEFTLMWTRNNYKCAWQGYMEKTTAL